MHSGAVVVAIPTCNNLIFTDHRLNPCPRSNDFVLQRVIEHQCRELGRHRKTASRIAVFPHAEVGQSLIMGMAHQHGAGVFLGVFEPAVLQLFVPAKHRCVGATRWSVILRRNIVRVLPAIGRALVEVPIVRRGLALGLGELHRLEFVDLSHQCRVFRCLRGR